MRACAARTERQRAPRVAAGLAPRGRPQAGGLRSPRGSCRFTSRRCQRRWARTGRRGSSSRRSRRVRWRLARSHAITSRSGPAPAERRGAEMAGCLFRLETAEGCPPSRPRSRAPFRTGVRETPSRWAAGGRYAWLAFGTRTPTSRPCWWLRMCPLEPQAPQA
jgi:hypothetical protein